MVQVVTSKLTPMDSLFVQTPSHQSAPPPEFKNGLLYGLPYVPFNVLLAAKMLNTSIQRVPPRLYCVILDNGLRSVVTCTVS